MFAARSESELRTGEQGPVRASVPEIEVESLELPARAPHSGLPAHSDSVITAPLHNDRPPRWDVLVERPEHRMIIILKSEGYNNREIAKMVGMAALTVSNLLRQDWARHALLALLAEAKDERLAEFVKREAINSLTTLVEIRDTAPRPSDRLRAATELVNRYLGKPTERVEVSSRKSTTLDEVNQEIAALQEEENALIGKRS